MGSAPILAMDQPNQSRTVAYLCTLVFILGFGAQCEAAEAAVTREEVSELRRQNELLQEQVKQQQTVIESLTRKVDKIEQARATKAPQLEDSEQGMKAAREDAQAGQEVRSGSSSSTGFGLNKIMISGEGGVGFFASGSEGRFPNGDFRVDEAKLFIETPVFDDVYFFTEINLMQRESIDLNVQLGECYVDFENVSKLWNRDRMLNIRLGRVDIPFGEEYLFRDAIDNPLISHSLTDFWGVDEGLELYGSVGKFSYAVAAQNGGANPARDFTKDKSVAGRFSYDPTRWLHLSISGMRTGDLDPRDSWSDLWFANGWFVSIGSPITTRFHANAAEGDIQARLPHGHIKLFGGYIQYDDNDPLRDNRRELYYYSVELVHTITKKFYAGGRFSQIFARNGYSIVGNGDMASFLFGRPTTDLWRLSLGLGYRFSPNLLFKAEYSFERGTEVSGATRDHEDFFGFEAAYRF